MAEADMGPVIVIGTDGVFAATSVCGSNEFSCIRSCRKCFAAAQTTRRQSSAVFGRFALISILQGRNAAAAAGILAPQDWILGDGATRRGRHLVVGAPAVGGAKQ